MDIPSPTSRKRTNSESPLLKSPKKHKEDTSAKENIPPINNDALNNLSSPGRVTPKKCRQVKDEPITPNANIKLLTSLAATLDYANICHTPKSTRSEQSSLEDINEENIILDSSFKISRKEKSLALVCFKFLTIYPLDPDPKEQIIVSLDEASFKLKVERRRLYDIVNVFESIEMLSKLAKNRYVWYGRRYLLKALNCIKNSAVCEGIEKKLKYVHDVERSSCYQKQSCILDEVQDFSKRLEMESECVVKELLTPSSPNPEVRKEKSLASMSQKFLMLFLVSPSKVISLGEAAKVLNGFQKFNKGAQIKTQIRRLYDIANVLSSVDLIEKQAIKGANGKKPAFKYIGPDLNDYNSKENYEANPSQKIKPKSLIRHSSFQEICKVAELEHQKLCLEEAPKSAPPFEKSLEKEPHFVNFNIHYENFKNDSSPSSLKINRQFNALQTIQPSSLNSNACTKELLAVPKPTKISIAKSHNTVNTQVPVLAKNGSYLLVNNNVAIPYTQPGTVFILNNYVPVKKSSNERNDKNLDKVSAQTIELSPTQRDNILKSLNISLTSGQVAAIQITGSTQSSSSTSNQCNLKIIDNSHKISSNKQGLERNDNTNNSESDGSSTANSTRNNSPTFQIKGNDSPFSIPSGYATPIPSSMSDITSFPSNSEVDSVLKKIENRSNTPVASESAEKTTKKETNMLHTFRNFMPIKGTPLSRHNSDSSESLNAEVSNIMREVPLGETTTASRPHSFLIDEKTILSPIKKPERRTNVLSPSPLITPPYISTDAIFVYQPFIKLQNTTGTKLEASLLKFKNNMCNKNV